MSLEPATGTGGFKSRLPVILILLALLATLLSPVRASSIDALDELDCVIYPSQEADIGSGTLGVLESLLVDRSEFVSEGSAVAQLESSAEQAAVELAAARASAAAEVNFRQLSADHSERQFSRFEQLVEKKAVSAKDVDDRKTEALLGQQQLLKAVENKNILALELARARVALEKRTIRSPFNGVVVERYKSAGEYVDSDPIMRIVQLHPLHIETIIPADQMSSIKPGMLAEIASADNPDLRWTARVDRVDNVVDVASATFGVRLELPNPDFAITAGLRCRLTFIDKKISVSNADSLPSAVGRHQPLEPKPLSDNATISDVKVKSVENDGILPMLAAANVSIEQPQNGEHHYADERIEDHNSTDLTGVSSVDSAAKLETNKTQSCIFEGPFSEQSLAEKRAEKLMQQDDVVEVISKSVTVKKGYLVTSPMFQTRDEAKTYVSTLEGAGVFDSFLSSKNPPIRVSVGAFRQQSSATSRMNQLSSNGIASEVRPWKKMHQVFYVVGNHTTVGDCKPPMSLQ